MHNKVSFTDQLCGLTANLEGKGGLEGEQGKGRFRGFLLLSKEKGPGSNCSSEFPFRMFQSNKLKAGVFFFSKIGPKH